MSGEKNMKDLYELLAVSVDLQKQSCNPLQGWNLG
jgi:hypothetical protein